MFPAKTSTPGSNRRKLWSLASIVVTMALIVECFHPRIETTPISLAILIANAAVIWSFIFFFLVVAAIPFLTSQDFWPDPIRLARDSIISITQTIFSFALLYRIHGIVGPENLYVHLWDYVYFSAVTFSTLGYGDFSPDEQARLYAAAQSILGNLHLGIIVGVAFFAAQKKAKLQR